MTEADGSQTTSPLSPGLERVLTRNAFYASRFYTVLGYCLLVLLLDGVLGGIAWYLVRHPTEPRYFPADTAGRLVYEVPLQEQNLSDQEIVDWVVHAVEAAYSYDFVNYHSQLQNAQMYFTDVGWREYMKGLQRSNNLIALVERKLIATAKVEGTPGLLKVGLTSQGRLAWKYQMQVLMHYKMPPFDGKQDYSNPLVVTVVVRREDILQSNNGLGIVQLNAFTAS